MLVLVLILFLKIHCLSVGTQKTKKNGKKKRGRELKNKEIKKGKKKPHTMELNNQKNKAQEY